MPVYNLLEPSVQHNFFLCRKPIQIFGGGFGNGKSAALCIKAINVARDYPGSNMLLARETYPKLNDTLRKEFFKWCPHEWIRRMPTKDDNTCYLHNGTHINFRYISQRGKTAVDGSTTSNLLSSTFDFIAVDQMEDPGITYKDFRDLIGRLRGTTPYRPPRDVELDDSMPQTGPRWLCLSLNPTHNWFYKEIVQPYLAWAQRGVVSDKLIVDKNTGDPIIELFEDSTYGNAHNLPEDFLRNMEATYTGQMRERFLMGKWAAFEGLVYPGFDERIHMVPREQIEAYQKSLVKNPVKRVKLRSIEAYDYGMAVPSCYLRGFIDDRGRIIWTHGYYRAEYLIEDQQAEMKRLQAIDPLNPHESDSCIEGDPALFKRSPVAGIKQTGRSLATLYLQDYNVVIRPSSNDITAGITKVSSYLAPQDAPNPFTGDERGPFMYFCDELDFVADEFNNYFWKRNPQGEQIDDPIGREDHAMDAIKYGVAKKQNPADIVFERQELPPAWMFWHEEDDSTGRSRRV